MFCSQCGAELTDGSKFCTNCGAYIAAQPQTKEAQPQASQPEEAQPYSAEPQAVDFNVTPVEPQAPAQPQPSIAKAIVSIATGGTAIFIASLTLLEVMATFEIALAFAMSFLVAPAAIVGLIFANGYIASGAQRLSGLAKAGKILSIVSFAVLGTAVMLGIFLSML